MIAAFAAVKCSRALSSGEATIDRFQERAFTDFLIEVRFLRGANLLRNQRIVRADRHALTTPANHR
jgi:hypothetical protein